MSAGWKLPIFWLNPSGGLEPHALLREGFDRASLVRPGDYAPRALTSALSPLVIGGKGCYRQ